MWVSLGKLWLVVVSKSKDAVYAVLTCRPYKSRKHDDVTQLSSEVLSVEGAYIVRVLKSEMT